MIETTLYNYLKSALTVPVYMEKPTNKSEFVLIEKTGSGKVNHITTATFAIQSWSTSMYNAASLNEAVKEKMEKIIEDSTADISKCTLNSDYNYTDTTTKSYRYQAVFDLVY